MRRSERTRAVSTLGLLALLATACAGGQKRDTPEVFWPLPPDPVRIRWVAQYSTSEDVRDPTLWDGVKELFAGRAPPQMLVKPYGVVADSRGRVFVSDTGTASVVVFDAEARSFQRWGREGSASLRLPLGLDRDSADHIYVADAKLSRVLAFDPEGRLIKGYGAEGELARPVDVAVDEDRGRLFVVDTGVHQVVVFDLESGELLERMGKRGSAPGQFNYPTTVDVGDEGRFFVMDTFNFRVQSFEPDLTPRNTFGKNCQLGGCLPRSKGVALSTQGHLYVSDAALNAVQIFDQDGALLLIFGGSGRGPGKLTLPTSVHVDDRDRIYVVDSINRRVNVYQYVEPTPEEIERAEAAVEEAAAEKAAQEGDEAGASATPGSARR